MKNKKTAIIDPDDRDMASYKVSRCVRLTQGVLLTVFGCADLVRIDAFKL